MKFVSFALQGKAGLAVEAGDGFRGRMAGDDGYPGDLESLIAKGDAALKAAGGVLAKADRVDMERVQYLPPLRHSGKLICVGLNYHDHSKESGFETPSYPAIFGRFNSSLIGHGQPIVRPQVSVQLDYEGELAAVIGVGGRNISEDEALDHVAGYSIFNDGSIRDYQFKSPQWTMGKNFDDTGPFGPCFVTADALPPGCKGLQLETRLNGRTVQSANIDDMVFSVARLVSILSEALTLAPGDVIVTGTPSGVGLARKPQLFMKDGDVCEVEIEGLGILRNPIVDGSKAA
ncbi:MAG: fumarylacetoacetate hydrolase family protein [Geminicoccaceae bacterium]|nr:fumarylacetoacetate hydrolase family protein [Geminicoccaceae bacterium]